MRYLTNQQINKQLWLEPFKEIIKAVGNNTNP
jgi:hypothetical protein